MAASDDRSGRRIASAVSAGLGAAFLIVASIARAISGPAITGTVTDKTTRQPVAGAQVVVVWDGASLLGFHSSEGGCHYVQNAVTDKDGRFSLPAWNKPVPNHILEDYRIGVYHRGHGLVEGEYTGGMAARPGRAVPGGNSLVLPPFSGTVKERLEGLQRMRTYVRCPEAGASRRNFLDFYRAMNDEIKDLLVTAEGQAFKAEEMRYAKSGEWRGHIPFPPTLAADLEKLIDSLRDAKDGELYEPTQQPSQ